MRKRSRQFFSFEKAPTSNTTVVGLDISSLQGGMASSAAVVNLLIEEVATPGVEDSTGRKPVHLVSYNSITTLNALEVGEGDFALKDKCE